MHHKHQHIASRSVWHSIAPESYRPLTDTMAETATSTTYSLLDIDMHTLMTRDFTNPNPLSEKEQEAIAYIRQSLNSMIAALNAGDKTNEVFSRIMAPNHKNISEGPYFAHHSSHASVLENIREFGEKHPGFRIQSGTVSVVPDVRKNSAQAIYSMELHGVPEGVTRPAVTQQEWKRCAASGVWQVLWCRTFFGMPLRG